MSLFRPFLITVCLCLPQGLWAQITASELWSVWQDGAAQITVAARDTSVVPQGLRLDGVVFTLDSGAAAQTVEIDSLRLVDRPDGTVAIEPSDILRVRPEPDGDLVFTVDLGRAGISAARDGDRLRYDMTAPSIDMGLAGGAMGENALGSAFGLVLRDVDSRIATDGAGSGGFTVESRTGRLDATVTVPGARGNELLVRMDLRDIESRSATAELSTLLNGGMRMPAGDYSLSQTMAGGGIRVSGDLPAGFGALDLAFDAAGFASSASGGVSTSEGHVDAFQLGLADSPAQEPVPWLSLDRLGYTAVLPIRPQPEPRGLLLDLSIRDLEGTPAFWTRMDPAGALPRDSLNATARLSGEGRLTGPLGQVPLPFALQLSQVTLEDLRLSGLGASLTGGGSVAAPQDPMRASGQLSFIATGVMDLLAALSQTGLLPPGQDMGARMGLMFFTVPDPDGDGLRSDVVFGPDGALSVNGNRLR